MRFPFRELQDVALAMRISITAMESTLRRGRRAPSPVGSLRTPGVIGDPPPPTSRHSALRVAQRLLHATAMKRLSFALPVALLLTACGEDLAVRIPIPDVCRTLAAQHVPASPVPGHAMPAVTWEQREDIALGDILPERRTGNVQLHLYVRSAELSAVGEDASLGFIHEVVATLEATPDGAQPQAELARYAKATPDEAPRTLALTTAPINLMDYVQEDTLVITETFTGVAPEQDTELSPKLCVGGEAVYTVGL